MFYNIYLFYDNVVIFYTYDVLDVSRNTVWLIGLNKYNTVQYNIHYAGAYFSLSRETC